MKFRSHGSGRACTKMTMKWCVMPPLYHIQTTVGNVSFTLLSITRKLYLTNDRRQTVLYFGEYKANYRGICLLFRIFLVSWCIMVYIIFFSHVPNHNSFQSIISHLYGISFCVRLAFCAMISSCFHSKYIIMIR